MWNEAGDDGEKYDEANILMREAEEKLASAGGHQLKDELSACVIFRVQCVGFSLPGFFVLP